MSDQTKEAEKKPDMPPQIANIHRSIYDAINLSKRLQWVITNYTVLVYGALFGFSRYFDLTISIREKTVLFIIASVACLCAIVLLVVIQYDLGRYRDQLDAIYKRWLSESEREELKLEGRYPKGIPALRGLPFLLAFIAVVAAGAALLIYSLLRPV